jgi:PH (Pleckstrin Homology) domain-containing protein
MGSPETYRGRGVEVGEETDLRADIASAKARMASAKDVKTEIRRLASHLSEGETVARMVAGDYGEVTVAGTSGAMRGLLVLTDRRILFVREGFLNKASWDFPLDKVSSVEWSGGWLDGTIVTVASGHKNEIRMCTRTTARKWLTSFATVFLAYSGDPRDRGSYFRRPARADHQARRTA